MLLFFVVVVSYPDRHVVIARVILFIPNDVEYLFLYLFAICISLDIETCVHVFCLFSNWIFFFTVNF